MLSIEDTLLAIEDLHSLRKFNEHPLFHGLKFGHFNKAQVVEFTKQFSIIPLHNHNYHGRLYVACPDPKWRTRIAEVVYEEGTGRIYSGGVAHNELYLVYSRGLGITDAEMWNFQYCAEALAFKSQLSNICTNFLEGVSAHMLAGERHGPGFFVGMTEGMKKSFGLTDEHVFFWVVHDEADADHSNIGVELLDKFAPTEADRRAVIAAVRTSLNMHYMLYDAVYREMQKFA